MKLLFELSGEHPELPAAEIGCVGKVLQTAPQVAIANCPIPEDTKRLSQTHVVMEYLGECPAERGAFASLLRDLSLVPEEPFSCRIKRIHPADLPASKMDLERMMGHYIDGTVSLKNPGIEYRAIFSDGHCYLGRVLHHIDRGSYAYRNPMRRPFFHPGVMMPLMARAMVNLTGVQPGGIFYDPFCGTGGIMLEAACIGATVAGSDIDPAMIGGARVNLPHSVCFLADTANLPIADRSVDAVATDLPYGQSTAIKSGSLEQLYTQSLSEIQRILKRESRAVIVTHQDISGLAGEYFEIIHSFSQRVHKSLTRQIVVLAQ
ncbi:MAG: Putative methyltransferase [Methanomicrobiales archaeon 53_19]|jgi:tRNA (guanine10-N2)-dimethyltransferase|uniref:methyltransferase domain-containing protein n=1 Tax=Methanocalculus sp. TaxID=2004547 RepID=UPI00074865F6|nr:methyltransferase domain-containing protein [Methanocalculus sp.]KUK71364.1 MAG: Putative methyltransferase [Methanocalculus sp. 52_23]KUL03700.1 MAG: Putative methyltransferase [Methanomicrobiales archaeon 53_19]HIJ06268.1 methyltransferase domain-containing protein [Methanocalculus sp.]